MDLHDGVMEEEEVRTFLFLLLGGRIRLEGSH